MMNDQVEQFVESRRHELVQLLGRLVAARTVNPPGDEYLAAEIMRETLEPLGIECAAFEKEPGRTNVTARIGSGDPRVLVACHFDVVPAGDGWKTDPFTAVVRDGRVYGRGTSDNKGQLAVMLELARLLKQNESNLIGQVILVGVADEERGSELGMEWLADEGMLSADFGVIPDIDNGMRQISIAEKGAFFLKITSHGKQAHGSTPELGVNAVWLMIELLNEVRRMDFTCAPDPLFTPPTKNLGMITGGSAPNIVPAKCEAQIDFRFLSSQDADEMEGAIKSAAARIENANEGAQFGFERLMTVDPIRVDADHPFVCRLRKKALAVLGWEPDLKGLSGSTVAKPLVRTGIPAVGFGPGEESQAHAANESIAIDELLDFAKVMGSFLIKEEL